jgi:hypothetical protein
VNMIAKERLYLTADKGRIVGHGDKRAAFLYAAPGDEIPENAAKKFGLVGGGLKASPATAPKQVSSKSKKGPADDKEQKNPAGDKTAE